jgi:transcription elongation GreA/GreB family factor
MSGLLSIPGAAPSRSAQSAFREETVLSVAFRKDSDEEHREPRFELPLPSGPNLVTERGLALINSRIVELEHREASSEEDIAREDARRDLRYWRTRHATAQLVPKPIGDEVAFGTRVKIRLNGAERTFSLVGDDEAEPASGLISFSAPLAKALLGAAVGDRLSFAGKEDAIVVLEVEPLC